MNSTTERIDKELKDYINKIMEICKKQGLDVSFRAASKMAAKKIKELDSKCEKIDLELKL